MQPTRRSRRHTLNSDNGQLTTPNPPKPARVANGDASEYLRSGKTTATSSVSAVGSGNAMSYTDFERDMRRSNTTGGKLSGLKRRIGSLRRSGKSDQMDGVVA